MDKAARAALLTAKGMDKTSENIADYVADLLRQGRAKEITDDLMAQADPQRLMHHYTTGNTGMDMPMDQASRMARAAKMGLTEKSYHGTGKSFPHFDPALGGTGAIRGNPIAKEGIFTSPMPAMADRYAEQGAGYQKYNEGGNNIPLMVKPATASAPLHSAKPEDLQSAKQQGHASVNLNMKEDPWETVTFDPTNIRSQFARFDPRLDHLAHLSASTGGAMDFARHVEAVQRAGGQIAPSKYLPNVPRQVHADGGKVVYHGTGEDYDLKDARMPLHFTENKDDAQDFADNYDEGKPRVIKARLRFKNPLRATSPFVDLNFHPVDIANLKGGEIDLQNLRGNHLDYVRNAGYDGITFPWGEHVALRPDVIREAHADGGKVAFMQGNHPDVPDVLYHGNAPQIAYKGWTSDIDHEQTQKNLEAQNFREFRPSGHGSYGAGIYLSDSPKVASDFAQSIRSDQKEPQPFGQVLKLHVSMKQPFTDDTLRHPEWKAYIKRALTRMSLPKQYEDDIAHRDAFLKALNKGTATVRDLFLRDGKHGTMVNQFGQDDIHNTIRNSGFDGIIAHRPDGSKEYVAFKPEQIKSATGNQGTFDPNDPDITKAGGGDVEGDDGITAYHSSPHDFDQFDVSKLGTGEGNQSYGPGLYFAENPKVSDRGGQYWNQFMNRGKMTPEKKAAFALNMAGWDRDKAVDRLQKRMEDHIDRAIPGKYGNGPVDEEGNRLLAQETQEAIDHVRSGKILGPRTYKVKLNVKPHELIDWDEPLSEQHPNIQAVLGSSHETAGSKLSRVNRNPNYRGDILGKDTATLQELYDHFRSKGIKGIRYNDAGSRHGPNGDLTKNYVMFHHDPVQVVDKYEYGGMVGKEEGGALGEEDGITAYHGSPYSFDKFDMGKIGTGVGAPSAFSKGLYFSENEKNAGHFKALGARPMVGGKKGPAGLSDDSYDAVWKFAHDQGKSGTLADVAGAAEADLLARSKELTFSARRDYQRVIDELKSRGNEDVKLGANMYKVKINAHPSTFADWDAPISQQSEVVRNAFSDFPQHKTFRELYDSGKVREEDLLNKGVSGAKFKANDGTNNYVVYDDKLINILRKYASGGTVAIPKARDVSDALALTRRFTKDGTGATMALKPKGK